MHFEVISYDGSFLLGAAGIAGKDNDAVGRDAKGYGGIAALLCGADYACSACFELAVWPHAFLHYNEFCCLMLLIQIGCLQHPVGDGAHQHYHGIGFIEWIVFNQPCTGIPHYQQQTGKYDYQGSDKDYGFLFQGRWEIDYGRSKSLLYPKNLYWEESTNSSNSNLMISQCCLRKQTGSKS
jgi:hypothetical protein